MMKPQPTRRQKHILRALATGHDIRMNQYGHRVLNGRTIPDAVIDVMRADGLLTVNMTATSAGQRAVGA